MRFKRCFALACLLLMSVLTCASPVVAQKDSGTSSTPASTPDAAPVPRFSIAPVGDYPDGYFSDVEAKPGSVLNLSVAIVNFGEVPVSLRTFKVNAHNALNGGFIAGVEDEDPMGSNLWVEYPATELDLDPGESQEISFTVQVPEVAQPGQYISGLTVETAEPLEIPGTQSLNQIIGYSTAVGLLVPGEISYAFELGAPDVVDSNGTRLLQIPVTNTGNYLVRPSGELTLTNESGDVVLTSPVIMKSVYAGFSTAISVPLADQMQPGDYSLNLSLKDEASGVSAEIKDAKVTVEEPKDPTGVSVTNAGITPNADPIAFANVDLTLDNGGQQIPASNVTLEVLHNGEQVDSFPLATNQVLLSGANTFTARYIPAEAWESGTYTFKIAVSAVDPNGGQETVLLTEDLDATIVVP